MNEDKERIEKSEKLFNKGMECYNNQQYKEAINYFEACIKFHKNDRAELFIKVCKNNIPEEENKKNYSSTNDNNTYRSNTNNFHKSYSTSNFGFSSNKQSYKKRNLLLHIIIFRTKAILQTTLAIIMKIKFVKN